MDVVGVIAALVTGFIAGLFSFKVKDRWCPACGATTITLRERRRQVQQECRCSRSGSASDEAVGLRLLARAAGRAR